MPETAASPSQAQADLMAVLEETRAESGRTLLELVDERPVLLVFLRHFGCSFCRQAIDDVSQINAQLQRQGVQAVFVHLGTPERAKPYFDYYKIPEVERISNPDASLYHQPAFELARVHLIRQVFRPSVWKSWLSGALRRHGVGLVREDGFQMPGVFFLRDRAIAASYRHRSIADRPDYLALIS